MESPSSETHSPLLAAVAALAERALTHPELQTLVRVALSLAESSLRLKRSAWKLMQMHDLDQSDLAYDCIADLFRRDDEGTLIELKVYFKGFDVAKSDEAQILVLFRRLVFAKVNNHLFHLLSESDTVQARILRNVKNAVQSMKHFVEIDRFGELHIVPVDADPLLECPQVQREELERLCFEYGTMTSNVPQLMAGLALALRQQTDRCRAIPMFLLAAVMKDVMEKQLPAHGYGQPHVPHLDAEDAVTLIHEACNDAHRKFTQSYVRTDKLSNDTLGNYIATAKELLMKKVVENDGHDASLYKVLVRKMPELTETEYRKHHKARLEYVAHFIYERIGKSLKQ